MIIEYIKRGQRLGYENGVLVYKLDIVDEAPAVVQEEETPEEPTEEDEAS
jgi:hypothetical protein